jgi:hypothetical protein
MGIAQGKYKPSQNIGNMDFILFLFSLVLATLNNPHRLVLMSNYQPFNC